MRTGPDRKPTDERVELGIRAAEPAQPGHRIRHRIVEDTVARGALAPAQGADPTACLGQVDQPEIERERPDDRLGGAEVEGAQLVIESGALERVVVAAQRDRPAPDPLDGGEQVRACLLRDDLAEQGAQQPDLGRERVAGAGRPDPERLGGDRGRGPSAARPRHALMRPAHAAPGAPAPADRSAPEPPPDRNRPGRNLSVGLYRDARDERPSRVQPSPRATPAAPIGGVAGRRPARTAPLPARGRPTGDDRADVG